MKKIYDITVIVPYYNESNTIVYTLDKIAKQTVTPKFAIFVNSSSLDKTSELIDEWISKNQISYQTIFLNIFGGTNTPASSKNLGICRSTTKWIAFMDCGQFFSPDWLQCQIQCLLNHPSPIVSGRVYTVGINMIDSIAVSHTYGYKNLTPCIPSSLVLKKIFNKTGLFVSNKRAGYDIAWRIKLSKLKINRTINQDISIQYIEANIADSFIKIFYKSILYSRPTIGIEGYYAPYLYLVGPLIIFPLILSGYVFEIFFVYILSRGYILPIIKSKNFKLFKDFGLRVVFYMPVIAFIIDSGKFLGILLSVKDLIKSKRIDIPT